MTIGHAPELPCLERERRRQALQLQRGALRRGVRITRVSGHPRTRETVNEMMTRQGAEEGRSSPTAPNASSVRERGRSEEATFAAP